jgi:hypothetical protein
MTIVKRATRGKVAAFAGAKMAQASAGFMGNLPLRQAVPSMDPVE